MMEYGGRRRIMFAVCAAMILMGIMCIAATPISAGPGEAKASADLSTAIAQVAKQNIPAVVHIEVTQRQELANPFLPFQDSPFFRYFFDTPRMPRKFKREMKGLGTGMIMDAPGRILTNNHVVAGAKDIQVVLADGKQYRAKIVGADPKTDLAVIQISTRELLPHVTFGDSDKVEVGEWVVAIGHPRGLDQTVTQGIISAKNRRGVTDPSSYQDFLQTDAAINPGNSGGPLLNLRGEVIGINAAIASESGGFEGIGFAIPSNMALHIASALIKHGKVERGWLGVSIQDLTPELAKSFGLKTPRGALITDVVKDGPADRAGMKRGDVVLSYQGKDISDTGALRNEVAGTPIGQQMNVAIWRDGKRQDLVVVVGNLEDVTKMLTASAKERLGVVVRPVTAKEAEKYGLDLNEGVAIRWLDLKGPLGEAGFEVGDILLEFNGEAIDSVETFANLTSGLQPHQEIVVLAVDHKSGQVGYVQIELK